ncbi:hypothetical protein [Micromonospora okii]|uniref:hypothetical protein n=1 Tax=Micromonospora okii TaxID=1182970 RepID=UPI001E346CC2|nr:hypothetical protein [Micromonospora okii]
MIHTFRLNGQPYRLDADTVRAGLAAQVREDVREHWVEVDGIRWPVKQAFGAALRLPRDRFTSHIALRHLRAVGFTTSNLPTGGAQAVASKPDLASDHGPNPAEAFTRLIDFTGSTDLTGRIADLEARMAGASQPLAAELADESGLTMDLLLAALLVRKHAGRLSDVIHAAVITQVVPLILEEGERVLRRPSLAAGNDPSRPYDLETDRRIAEFKMSVWKGADAMRQRGTFADLVHLALDESERQAQLYVAGPPAIRFLRSSTGTAAWALNRSSPVLRRRFEERFGSPEVQIRDFVAGPAAHVEMVDLTDLLPAIALAIA